jgi:hypothetical protein
MTEDEIFDIINIDYEYQDDDVYMFNKYYNWLQGIADYEAIKEVVENGKG